MALARRSGRCGGGGWCLEGAVSPDTFEALQAGDSAGVGPDDDGRRLRFAVSAADGAKCERCVLYSCCAGAGVALQERKVASEFSSTAQKRCLSRSSSVIATATTATATTVERPQVLDFLPVNSALRSSRQPSIVHPLQHHRRYCAAAVTTGGL